MYPQWLVQMFTGNKCVKCRVAVTTDDIDAVGLRRPMPNDDPAHPLALVIATCKHCGQWMHFSMRLDLPTLLNAVTAFAARIAEASQHAQADGSGFAVQPPPSNGSPTPAVPANRPRPSRRAGQPLTPLT